MRKFVVNSKNTSGSITFGYDQDGKLISFLFESVMTDAFTEWARTNMPWNLDQLLSWKSKTTTVTEVTDISFDRFWKDYDYKKGKENALKEWNKLTVPEHVKAIVRIPAYKYDIGSRNIAPLYPERYLKYKRFNDE